VIESQRIRLRTWCEDDVGVLQALRNDVELQGRLLARARGSSRDEVTAWLRRRSAEATTLFWVVADPATDAALGYLQITALDPTNRHADLGICLAPGAQGRGLGSEVLAVALRHLRDEHALRKVSLRVRADLANAIRCYTRAGFVECGRQRSHFTFGGAWHDVVLMEALLADAA
jgi:RimJ/RimL family protein N-acetyltransferase